MRNGDISVYHGEWSPRSGFSWWKRSEGKCTHRTGDHSSEKGGKGLGGHAQRVCVCVCVCVCVWFVTYTGHFLTKESTRKLSKHGYQWEKKEMERRRKTEARLPGTYRHPSFYCAVLPCAAHLLLFFVCVFSGSWHTIVFSFGCTTQWLHIYITFKQITPDQPSTQHMFRFSQNEGQILHQQKTSAWLCWFETKPTMCPKYLAFVTM